MIEIFKKKLFDFVNEKSVKMLRAENDANRPKNAIVSKN